MSEGVWYAFEVFKTNFVDSDEFLSGVPATQLVARRVGCSLAVE